MTVVEIAYRMLCYMEPIQCGAIHLQFYYPLDTGTSWDLGVFCFPYATAIIVVDIWHGLTFARTYARSFYRCHIGNLTNIASIMQVKRST